MDQTTFGDEPPPNHEITRKVSSLNEDHPRVEIPPGRHWIRRQWERFFLRWLRNLRLLEILVLIDLLGFTILLSLIIKSLRHWQTLQKDV